MSDTPRKTNLPVISRRTFLSFGALAAPLFFGVDSYMIEPQWLKIKKVVLSEEPSHRIAHFSDLHYVGDKSYLAEVVDAINGSTPDLACFTGDIVEKKEYLSGALEAIERINCPVYGVPGNHEYWSGVSFEEIARTFSATGGEWIVDKSVIVLGGKVGIAGITGRIPELPEIPPAPRRIFMMHYPVLVDKVGQGDYDLILAGHSHGGQVRIPLLGAPVLPRNVGSYDKGLFQTQAGMLYVNPGIGYLSSKPLRFCCRPELTIIDI